jgi:hypothetical protein
MALMIRNPTKHMISGSVADLWQTYRNSLCGATFQAVSSLFVFFKPSAAYAESPNKLFF